MRMGKSPAVSLYDTTLRDGTQREGLSLSSHDKIRIAERLDAIGVAFIEAGFPGSNPKDAEVFARARDLEWQHAALAAFGATRRAGTAACDDPQLAALVACGAPVCTIFGKSWDRHVTAVLRTTYDENLRMIEESVAFLRAAGRRVVYDAEHFFDGFAADSVYAVETVHAAVRGGAECVVLCDTNGGTLPWRVGEVVTAVRKALALASTVQIGIHAHDDVDCAVANTLSAVAAGASHVQCTVNGYGERCGNASLCTVAASLELKLGMRCLPEGGLQELSELSRFVAEVANLPLDHHMPFVGRSAFAHKGGVHAAAVRRDPGSYEHVDPAAVGNVSRVVVSELSGRANVLAKAEEHGVHVVAGDDASVVEHIKECEARGFSFEAAEASVALLLRRRDPAYKPPFTLLDYRVMSGCRRGTEPFAEAVVKIEIGDRVLHTAAEGNGPVSALDAALRKALEPMFPELAGVHLADYKVRVLDGTQCGTGATTRVLVDSRDSERAWSTVGASSNIVEASLAALLDSYEHALLGLDRSHEAAA